MGDDAGGGGAVPSDATAPRGGLEDGPNATGDESSPLDDSSATPVDVAPPSVLFLADAPPMRAASDCKPGTYTGTFVMMVTFGGFNGPTLMGPLSITLVANKPSPHPGEFNSGTLTVAPGAMFKGTDNLGDVITADLSGQLDCGSRTFVGALTNGVSYIFGSEAATVQVDGSMSATYDPTANPVGLVDGSFQFTSPQFQNTTGSGQWSAALQ